MKRHFVLLQEAFQISTQILFAYLPIGFAFGLVFEQLNYPWFYAPLMSFLAYSPSAQFLLLSIISVKGSLSEIMTAAIVISLRQIFFGISLLDRYPKGWGPRKLYLVLGLSDETYSLLSVYKKDNKKDDQTFILYLTILNHLYLVVGSLLGAISGKAIPHETPGLEFMMTALFVVLTVEQAMRMKNKVPFIVAIFSGLVARYVAYNQMLFISIVIAAFFLVGIDKWQERRRVVRVGH